MEYALRRAREQDLDELSGIVAEGMATFAEFAGEGWQPPDPERERGYLQERLEHPRSWALVGVTPDDTIAGHVAFLPATAARKTVSDETLAHLYHLFVRREHWGSGLAGTLIRRAQGAAAGQGYTAMRLFTPAQQRRARRFYEREGWSAFDAAVFEPHLGLEMIEYRIVFG